MSMYKDPPHQTHQARLLEGTEAIPTTLTPLDVPKEEPLWCKRHSMRMANRGNGGWGNQGGGYDNGGYGGRHGGRGRGRGGDNGDYGGRHGGQNGFSGHQSYGGRGGAGGYDPARGVVRSSHVGNTSVRLSRELFVARKHFKLCIFIYPGIPVYTMYRCMSV